MKKTVLKFGLMSGAVISALLLATLSFHDAIGFEIAGLLVGYATMVLAFLLIYFGVRSYRDEVAGGRSAHRPRLVALLRRHLAGGLLQLHARFHGQVRRARRREGSRVG
jgi:hypothetical protein